MNELDRRRWEHSQQTLEKAKASEIDKPEMAAYWYGSAYQLMAAVKLNSGMENEAIEILNNYLVTVSPFYTSKKIGISPIQQNDLLFIAGYTNNFNLAKEIVALPVEASNEHGFIQTINFLFRSWFGNTLGSPPSYKPDKSEQDFFQQFSTLANGGEFNAAGIDKFWTATKNKRYKDLIWGKTNIFGQSLKNYAEAYNKSLKDAP